MTAVAGPAALRDRLRLPRPYAGILLAASVACLVVVGVAAVGLITDPRLVTGAPAWLKPLKFAVSISVYCATLAWLLTLVQGWHRLVRVVAWATGLSLALELGLIVFQAVRGQASHYNISTPFDMVVLRFLAAPLPAIYTAAVVTAVLLIRQRRVPPVLASGIRGGLLVCLLGMAQGTLMIFNSANSGPGMFGAHTVGGLDGGPGLPLTDWSTQHGDLRVAHFVGLHALQVLPLLAWLLQRYATRLTVLTQVRMVRVTTLSCAGLIGLLTWQAERGLPLLHPDATVLGAAAAGIGLAAAALAAILVRDRRSA